MGQKVSKYSRKSLRAWAGSTVVGRAIKVLSRADRQKVFFVVLIQTGMGLLDLAGVAAVGLLGALSVQGIETGKPGNRVGSVLKLLGLSHQSFQAQVAALGGLAVSLLIGRTLISIFFTKKILYFFSIRGATISSELVSRVLAQPLLQAQATSSQETLYSITFGVGQITMKVLAVGVVMLSDLSLLIVMSFGLFFVDIWTALGSILVFSGIAMALYKNMHLKATSLGTRSAELSVKSNEKIIEALSSFRETVVGNRRAYYAREIGNNRYELAGMSAELDFMPFISKYVIELSVVIGTLLIGASQFLLRDATHAVATLALFMAAGTRIAPAVLRVQQASIQMKGSLGSAGLTLDLIDRLRDFNLSESIENEIDIEHQGFEAAIKIEKVSFTYPGNSTPTISDASVNIPVGAAVALVGSSGAGKTTFADIILGLIVPDKGHITLSGLPPLDALNKWPGAAAYVPQDVVLSNGSIRENVGLGYPKDVATDAMVLNALRVAHLDEFVKGLSEGLDTQIGERGAKISGGQRQRLGIARAMFTRPHLLVLDEATSALDGETEAAISDAIHELRGSTTVVMIAHRLSTVRNADIVVYLDKGRILAQGTFDEVREAVPDFDRQAKLMGL